MAVDIRERPAGRALAKTLRTRLRVIVIYEHGGDSAESARNFSILGFPLTKPNSSRVSPPMCENPRGHDVNLRSGPQMREYRSIVRSIQMDRPGRLLDWGCGWGQVTDLLVESGVETVAFDYRPDIATDGYYPLDRYPSMKAYLSSDPRRLPFDSGFFSAVLSCGVLEHVEDPEASLREIHRVLEPGGTLYVFKLPNRFSYLEHLGKRLGYYYHGAFPNDLVYDRRSALAILERNQFRVTQVRRANMLPLTLTGSWAARWAEAIWRANRLLSAIPIVNFVATNLELTAVAQ